MTYTVEQLRRELKIYDEGDARGSAFDSYEVDRFLDWLESKDKPRVITRVMDDGVQTKDGAA